MSIYNQIGGNAAVVVATDKLYEKIMADDVVNGFFKNTNIESQKLKMQSLLTTVLGGPDNYHGKDLRSAHKHLRLQAVHFDAVAGHVVSTLTELEVPAEIQSEIVTILLGTKNDVLNVPLAS